TTIISPDLSADGALLVFRSNGVGVVGGTTPNRSHLYLHDIDMLATEILDEGDGGAEADDSATSVGISGDGRYAVLETRADNIVPAVGGTNELSTYVRDLATGVTELVSINTSGIRVDGETPSISFDGRFIAFTSSDKPLVVEDTNNARDVFVLDRDMNGDGTFDDPVMLRASVQTGGAQVTSGNSFNPRISADGRWVAFDSDSAQLVAGDSNNRRDVFVHDLQTVTTVRVSLTTGGGQGSANATDPAISGDGRFVVFQSNSAFTPEASNNVSHVFLRDRDTDEDGIYDEADGVSTTLMSRNAAGNPNEETAYNARVSVDGTAVAFTSSADNLVPGDNNNRLDTFVRDLVLDEIVRASVTSDGAQVPDGGGDAPLIRTVGLSMDGRFTAFTSSGDDLVGDSASNQGGIFIRDRDVTEGL
ncbi:MAG: hypothetical protein K8I02_11940, partial [Candidatus Methylomirabilis sp.]|nr:hypothetical protein [Deltaproteobacteria bacterium]